MTRFLTAPGIGLVVGALEGGVAFTILTLIDVERGKPAAADNELIYLGTVLGLSLFFLVALSVIALLVHRMSDESVRACSNQPTRGGIRSGMSFDVQRLHGPIPLMRLLLAEER